jgi:hypothetical protein
MGVGRTTFAMVVATVIRRKQILALGDPDPILTSTGRNSITNTSSATDESPNHAMLRLVFILENALSFSPSSRLEPQSAIKWALDRGPLIEDLKSGLLGDYQIITKLVSVLARFVLLQFNSQWNVFEACA